MSISQNIRMLRKEFDMSQEDLAKRLGYQSFTTIQKWESGVSEPPLKIAKALSEIFHVDLDVLCGSPTAVPDQTPDPKESALLGMYRQLNPEGKEKLEERAEELIRMEYTLEADAKKGRDASA